MTVARTALACLLAASLLATSVVAAVPETLTGIAFATPDKNVALSRLAAVLNETGGVLARLPNDRDALLQHSIALAYRAQLTRSAGDAKAARRGFETIVARSPNDAEALMALASWHLNSVADLGSFVSGAVLGASRKQGEALLARALASGGDRALFPAYAALLRIKLTPDDLAGARLLAERALRAKAPTALDQAMQKRAGMLLPALKPGNDDAASRLAKRLLPLGQIAG